MHKSFKARDRVINMRSFLGGERVSRGKSSGSFGFSENCGFLGETFKVSQGVNEQKTSRND
jgi:hypothetical protein